MTSAEISIIITVVLFFIVQVIGMARFTGRATTQIAEVTRCLREVEKDLKQLVQYDTKIEVLHERMNQSQADRRTIWEALEGIRQRMP